MADFDAARIMYTCVTFTASCALYCVLYEESKAGMCSRRQSNVMDTIRRRDVGLGEKIKHEKGGGGGVECE